MNKQKEGFVHVLKCTAGQYGIGETNQENHKGGKTREIEEEAQNDDKPYNRLTYSLSVLHWNHKEK